VPRRVRGPDGVVRVFPDDATDAEIAEALEAAETDSSSPPPGMALLQPPTQREPGEAFARRSVAALPTILAGLGGIPKGPPGMIGAALGGGGGEFLRQMLGPAFDLPVPEDRIGAIGREAAGQVALQATGGLLSGGATKVARPLMKMALRPTARTLEQRPTIVREALSQRARVGAGGAKAAAKARNQAGQETRRILIEAKRQGVNFDVSGVDSAVRPILREARLAGDRAADRTIRRMVEQFKKTHSGPITPTRLKEIKQVLQRRSGPVLRAIERGEPIGGAQATAARVNHALSRWAREQLETIPGVAEREAVTQSRIMVGRAVRRAESLPQPMLTTGIGTNVLREIMAGGGFLPPGLAPSVASLLLTGPLIQTMLRQGPRAAAESLRQVPEAEVVP
jgi:hypothetical protein